MSLNRIKAIFLQEYFHSRKSLEVIMDLVFFSIMNVILFGFISLFLAGNDNRLAGYYVVIGVLLWEIIRINQYSVSVGTLWNVWSHNLSNIFITPISSTEYMLAHMLSAFAKTAVLFVVMAIISVFAFKFSIFSIGLVNMALIFMNLTIFAWSAGLILLGFIFRYGTRIQALAWGTIFIFQPLTAAFFPLSVLPDGVAWIARALPPTYAFETARLALKNPGINWSFATISLALNIVYFLLAAAIFNFLFRRSKETGQFARNDS